jgi:UDP-N-acetylglucosamine 2-epimerase (non-hydrolysing)
MQKVITILGTRPEIIRLSRIMPKLDKLCQHLIVHTTQNYDYKLNEIFFEEMKLRKPDIHLEARSASFGGQIAIMLQKIESVFNTMKPDKVVVLGDTNSGLCSIVAERMGIPVYHLEAGNRCFDKTVPEEVNRKIIDSISSYNMPYTPGSRENLLNEGIHKSRIFTCGNPIGEVLSFYEEQIARSTIARRYQLEEKPYFLATFHRAETVDVQERLANILAGLIAIEEEYKIPIVCSIHPRTKEKLKGMRLSIPGDVMFLEPFGFFDFISLERKASCVLTDSGTVSEETCILGVPCVIIRDVTERPEVLECGSAMLSGVNAERMVACTKIMMEKRGWEFPIGYICDDVSDRVVQFILGGTK